MIYIARFADDKREILKGKLPSRTIGGYFLKLFRRKSRFIRFDSIIKETIKMRSNTDIFRLTYCETNNKRISFYWLFFEKRFLSLWDILRF